MKKSIPRNTIVESSGNDTIFCPTMLKEALSMRTIRMILNRFFYEHNGLLDMYNSYFLQPTTVSPDDKIFVYQFADGIHNILKAVIKHINTTSSKVLSQTIKLQEVHNFDFIAEDSFGHSVHPMRRIYYIQRKINEIFSVSHSLFEGYQVLFPGTTQFPPFQQLIKTVLHHHKSIGLFLDAQNSVNPRIYENATMLVVNNCLKKMSHTDTNTIRNIRRAVVDQPINNHKPFHIDLNWTNSPDSFTSIVELPGTNNIHLIESAAQETIAVLVKKVREIETEVLSITTNDTKEFKNKLKNRQYRISAYYVNDIEHEFHYDYERICDLCAQYVNKKIDSLLFALSPEKLVVFHICLNEIYRQLPPEVVIPLIQSEGVCTIYAYKDPVNFAKIVDNLPLFKSLAYACFERVEHGCFPLHGIVQTFERKIYYY